MATTDQQQRILKTHVAIALHDILGRVPKDKEINYAFVLTRVLCHVLDLHPKS